MPDDQCQKCVLNGTTRTLANELAAPFSRNRQLLYQFTNKSIPAIDTLESLFVFTDASQDTSQQLNQYIQTLLFLESRHSHLPDTPTEVRLALQKLIVIGHIVESFLNRNLTPPVVAPYRQVGLQAKCNARCIQCMFLPTREIIDGPELDPIYIDEAFSESYQIIDFFMYGSELLCYRSWKSITKQLKSNGVPLGISTNGIALTSENIKFLIDHHIFHALNISLDGATRETVENIRINVNFDRLIRQIQFLLDYSNEKKYFFALIFSFVLMKRNYHELPQMIRLMGSLLKNRKTPIAYVSCQALVHYPHPHYDAFVAEEHHTCIPTKDLLAMFHDVKKASHETGIQTTLFSFPTIDDFFESGCPIPTLDNKVIHLLDKSLV